MGEVLVNVLFAGAYLEEETNIGHEVINLFKDDKDRNYLFITPSGSVKDHDVDEVVFVQNIEGNRTVEVIMRAGSLFPVDKEEENGICYAGVNVNDIFSNNIYHGKEESESGGIIATYRSENIRYPKSGTRIILTFDREYKTEDKSAVVIFINTDKKKISQKQRAYFTLDTEGIRSLLENEDLWEKENTSQRPIPNGKSRNASNTFLEIIRKEDDELVFSNLLAYYFEYNYRMFVQFTKEVLGVKEFEPTYQIIRESVKNIDLWIEDKNHVLVIENKVKSNLNGKTSAGEDQLNKYYDCAEEYCANENKTAYYFIFTPNYNVIVPSDPKMKDIYRVISYKQIYEFFEKHAIEYIDDKYFPDFLTGIKKHTMSLSELRFSIMRSRLLEIINRKKG